jgi:hypothetical protein
MKSFSVSTSSLKSSENIPQLKQEIVALEELSRQLFIDIHDLINMRERLEWSKTWQGKYFNFLGYFFSLYCTWKIFISTVNIVFNRQVFLTAILHSGVRNYFFQSNLLLLIFIWTFILPFQFGLLFPFSIWNFFISFFYLFLFILSFKFLSIISRSDFGFLPNFFSLFDCKRVRGFGFVLDFIHVSRLCFSFFY